MWRGVRLQQAELDGVHHVVGPDVCGLDWAFEAIAGAIAWHSEIVDRVADGTHARICNYARRRSRLTSTNDMGPETGANIGTGMGDAVGWVRAAAVVLLVLSAGCAPRDPTPLPTPTAGILHPGATAAGSCQLAVVALDEHSALDDEFGMLERSMFEACTFAEFSAFNNLKSERYRYPGDGSGYVERNCRRAASAYKGSRLCETLP